MDVSNHEPKNAGRLLGLRPDCGCCAGGFHRKGRKYTRVKSAKLSNKARRSKPKSKDHR